MKYFSSFANNKNQLSELVNFSKAGNLYDTIKRNDAIVFENIISKSEHDNIIEELFIQEKKERALNRFRNRKYDEDHWDSVIIGYKELERPILRWNEANQKVLIRIQEFVHEYLKKYSLKYTDNSFGWLPPHVIELGAQGYIGPHVDSIKFSGQCVSGLSLLSHRTMRLRMEQIDEKQYNDQQPCIDLSLPPCSLYIICNDARYKLAHSIESNKDSSRRVSIIFRDILF